MLDHVLDRIQPLLRLDRVEFRFIGWHRTSPPFLVAVGGAAVFSSGGDSSC
jgi:hypothetical protein